MTIKQLERQLLEQRAARLGTTVEALMAAQGLQEQAVEEPIEDVNNTETSIENATASRLVNDMVNSWHPAMSALSRASSALLGISALLGDGAFAVDDAMWSRRGWAALDALRSKLERLKELRDLVRSLGRGGGWGPLRRAPVQHLDMGGRPGLLRTVLEAQETRGLTRSDDISRLLPSEVGVLGGEGCVVADMVNKHGQQTWSTASTMCTLIRNVLLLPCCHSSFVPHRAPIVCISGGHACTWQPRAPSQALVLRPPG